MKTVANLFATTHTVLGMDHQKDRHFVTIERFPPDEDGYCTFIKSVEGLAQNEYWVAREKNILMLLKKTPYVVRLRKEEEKNDTSYQTVKTRDAGISLAHWLRTKPQVQAEHQPLNHPFEMVGCFLALAKHCMQALKNIHQMGVIHANLRLDNICVPYAPYPYEFSGSIKLDYENLALIDFMFAISNALKLSRPLPVLTAPKPSSQSGQLVRALEEDRENRNADRIQRIDYSVDMYALGVILEQIFQQNLIYPSQRHAELSMEIHNFIAELKSYENGIPDAIKIKYFHLLPHDSYIKHLDHLLSLDPKAINADSQLLSFNPAQFLEDDMVFSSQEELLEPESVTMTVDQQKAPSPAATQTGAADAGNHIVLNKGMIIVLIITAQAVSFIMHKGNELGLDILASSGLLLVLGIAAALACKLLNPVGTPALATPELSLDDNTLAMSGRPAPAASSTITTKEPTIMKDHPSPASATNDSDVIHLKTGVIISLILTALMLFFVYREGHHLNLDILSSMGLILIIGVFAAFAGTIFSPTPAPKLRPIIIEPGRVPDTADTATTDTSPAPVSLDEIDAIAAEAGVSGRVAPAVIAAAVAETAAASSEALSATVEDTFVIESTSAGAAPATPATATVEPVAEPDVAVTERVEVPLASEATVKPAASAESVNLSKAAAAALAEDDDEDFVEPAAQDKQEAVELNKWMVIAVVIALQIGLFAWHLIGLNNTAVSPAPSTESPAESAAVETPAATEIAPEAATDDLLAETTAEATVSPGSAAATPVNEAAAANIALLSETSSVKTPEASTQKAKKDEVDSFLLSGSPSNTAAKPVKKEKPVVAKTVPVAVDTAAEAAAPAAVTSVESTPAVAASTPAAADNKTKPAAKEAVSTDTAPGITATGANAAAPAAAPTKPAVKSLTRGLAESQNTMGWHYYHGDGVPKDYEEAAKWFQKAANLGEPSAQFNLGMMYAAGNGVKQDLSEAAKWYRKSAEQGKTSAQLNLGMMYVSGRGVRQNIDEGVKWLNKAADQGDATAKANLAWLIQQGYVKGGDLKVDAPDPGKAE